MPDHKNKNTAGVLGSYNIRVQAALTSRKATDSGNHLMLLETRKTRTLEAAEHVHEHIQLFRRVAASETKA